MSTQLVAIFVVLGLALLALVIGWSALAVSQREEQELRRWIETMRAVGWQEWPASTKGDYSADDAE